MSKPKTSIKGNSFIGLLQTIVAILITILFASGLYGLQFIIDTSKFVQSSTPLKATLWFIALMLGSFCYDTFKSIINMPITTFNNFSINVKGVLTCFVAYCFAGAITLILLDLGISGLLVAFFLTVSLFFLYRTIHYFDKAINNVLQLEIK